MSRPVRILGNLETAEICSSVELHHRCFLCELSDASLREFDAICLSGSYPRGAKLFAQGQHPKGVFVLCRGRVKLSVSSGNGRSLMRIVEQGEILGLSAVLSGNPYEDSAEMLEGGQISFIWRNHFLNFLNNQSEASLLVAQHLSNNYTALHEQMRVLALSDSVAEKLARLLLSWCRQSGKRTNDGIQLKISLTHGEISQMIGVSRETVTRLLGELRNKGTIQLKGSNLLIKDKAALEECVRQ